MSAAPDARGAPVDLAALAAEAGWPAPAARDDGTVAVELDVPEAYFTAELTAAEAIVRCVVHLAWSAAAPATCRRAAIRLLARAGEVMQDVVPAVDDGGARFSMEVAADPVALERALGALTVACRLFGRELDLILRSPVLAALLDAAAAAPPRPDSASTSHLVVPSSRHPNPEEIHP